MNMLLWKPKQYLQDRTEWKNVLPSIMESVLRSVTAYSPEEGSMDD